MSKGPNHPAVQMKMRAGLCVVKYSASFSGEQLHSLTTSVSKVLQYLRRFAMELNKPKARWDEKKIRSKIQRWLSGQFLTVNAGLKFPKSAG